MSERKRVTLRDIARFAEVSTGTVSMVLNNNPLVASATRAHVQQIIDQFGYVYDRSGAQLRNKRTGIVGVCICNLANPYFAEITVGIEEALGASRLALVLGHSAESVAQQAHFLNTAREHNVEGLIMMPAVGTTRAMIESVLSWGIPLVMVTRYTPGIVCDYAGSDNARGAVLATRHLLELGHQRIAFVGANTQTSTGRDRIKGFRAALRQADRAPAPELVVACEASREHGFAAARQLCTQASPPTAILCFNDLLAFGVMLGLRSLGLEPGRDCSVVGTDDVAEAALWQPGLSTVAVHSRQIGQSAGRLLRERLAEPERPPERILLQPELVVRGSSGPLPQAQRARKSTPAKRQSTIK